jgi:phosphocarrier protein HPr
MAFVETASEYDAKVTVRRAGEEERVDGKSIMHMMMLAATKGTALEIVAEGEDAEQAVGRLEQLVNDNFGED